MPKASCPRRRVTYVKQDGSVVSYLRKRNCATYRAQKKKVTSARKGYKGAPKRLALWEPRRRAKQGRIVPWTAWESTPMQLTPPPSYESLFPPPSYESLAPPPSYESLTPKRTLIPEHLMSFK